MIEINDLPVTEQPHDPHDPWGWITEILEKNSSCAAQEYTFTGGLWHYRNGKCFSGKVYVMNVESRRYYFQNGVPEVLVFSMPTKDPLKMAQWGLILMIGGKMTLRSYDTAKGAKIAAQNFLRRFESPYGNGKRKNTWFETSQAEHLGKRIDVLIEMARRKGG